MFEPSNLFQKIPSNLPDEIVETIVKSQTCRIERIVSHGQASPEGFWYDQANDEWVILLRGAARIQFENQTVDLTPADFVNILAHQRHRVEWTTPDEPTLWLAVHYGELC